MQKKKLVSSILFFIVGVILFLIVYRNFDMLKLKKALSEVHFGWIVLSVILGIGSHFIRALRWKMLINTLGYKPKTVNLFLSVVVLYFTNLVIPRGGEISRCAVISKYEDTPFVKLLGTVFIERVTDMCAFILIFAFVLIWNFSVFRTIVNYPEFDFSKFHLKHLTVLLFVIVIGTMIFLVIKFHLFKKVIIKVKQFKEEFIEGFSVIRIMDGKIKYIFYTFLIFILWFFMLYVVFFAYPPTIKLTFFVAIMTYTFGTLAYLLPIQAGIGTWHFIVINCLFFFGIDKASGMIFALIAHTFTNLIFVIFGPIALAILPLINNKSPKINM